MKRHSKLLPETFAKAITLGLLDAKNITEEVILEKCPLIQNGLQLSKQAIKDRLEQSGPFLKALDILNKEGSSFMSIDII